MSIIAHRFQVAGGIIFVLAGIAHAIGQFMPGTLDPGSAAVERAMNDFMIPAKSFTYWNVMQCWGALYGGMTMLFGVLMLTTGHYAAPHLRLQRAACVVGATAAMLQTAAALRYATPPPAFFMVPAAVVLLIAALLPARRTA